MDFTREKLLKIIQKWLDGEGATIIGLETEAGVPKDCVRDFLRGKVYIPRADKLQKLLAVVAPDMKF